MSIPQQSNSTPQQSLPELETKAPLSSPCVSHDTTSSATLVKMPSSSSPGTEASSPSRRRPSLLQRLDAVCLKLPPAFFSINMGTGITSILLYNLPYNAEWLRILGIVIFVLNVAIFAVLCLGNMVRYVRYKGLFSAVGSHLAAGMFWGTLPMGMATIINMIAFVCVPAWGYRWAQLALGLWWINVLMSILVNFGMVFMIFTRHKHTPESMTAGWLLPIVSSIVAAASGGVVANALMPFDPALARATVLVAYVVWGTGVPLACMVMTLWIYRTATVGCPPGATLPSLFLPLGPCGQGSFGIMLLGRVMRSLAYEHGVSLAVLPAGVAGNEAMYRLADTLYAGGIATGLILWGLGLCWYLLAFAMTIDHIRKNKGYFARKAFSVAWTAYTFPIGVFATATTELAAELDSVAFRVIGTFISIQVAIFWLYVMIMILVKAFDGSIFVAAELAVFDGKPPLRFGGGAKKRDTDVEKA